MDRRRVHGEGAAASLPVTGVRPGQEGERLRSLEEALGPGAGTCRLGTCPRRPLADLAVGRLLALFDLLRSFAARLRLRRVTGLLDAGVAGLLLDVVQSHGGS